MYVYFEICDRSFNNKVLWVYLTPLLGQIAARFAVSLRSRRSQLYSIQIYS
jgi:hypothetical protein